MPQKDIDPYLVNLERKKAQDLLSKARIQHAPLNMPKTKEQLVNLDYAKAPGFNKKMKDRAKEIRDRKKWTPQQWEVYNKEQDKLRKESEEKFFSR